MSLDKPVIPALPQPGGVVVHDALKRYQVQVLRDAGLTLREVATKAGVSPRSVDRILLEPRVTELASGPVVRVGRPSVARAFEAPVRSILEAEPELPTVEVLRRISQQGYRGRKTALYDLVAQVRPRHVAPMVRFEGVAGEFSQHDFGQVRVRYDDGSVERVRFFVSRLKWCRWTHVKLVADESVESLVRALLEGFESFGGVPLVCVFDNPTTVVISRKDNVIRWNDTFGQVALDYRFAPELCTPRRANQKGSVENGVGFVKGNFFKVRRFHDRSDLESQLVDWHREVNHERPSRATNVVPAVRIEEERRRLRPLPIAPSEYALRFPVHVGPTGWVQFDGVRYSMPATCLNWSATLFLYEDRVRIVTGQFDVPHPRHPANGISTLAAHATEGLAVVHGRRSKLYYQRQRLLELGPVAESFLTELVHARPRVWAADVERLFQVLIERGPERLTWALQQALARGQIGSEYVTNHLRPEAVLA